jgi:UDP-2-acetamido-2,6-beta-L-arabino-hexul-4-ose reductase
MKVRVGITGESGFVGSFVRLKIIQSSESHTHIPSRDCFFQDPSVLRKFVHECDVIVHLAAMNRTDGEPSEIYETNMRLVQQLIEALQDHPGTPHVIFASSIQEERDNIYGRSKRDGRMLLAKWAMETQNPFSGLLIPNVFGPYGRPNYNSVVATFCHQLTQGETPIIDQDAEIPFIHVWDLAQKIHEHIENRITGDAIAVAESVRMKVSTLLEHLQRFQELYGYEGRIPGFENGFLVSLFNTFRSYYDESHFPLRPLKREDDRGYLVELLKTATGGQVFYSVSRPGITRGNHYHTRKIERFCVLEGEAVIRIRRVGNDKVQEYHVTGEEPGFVDMPVFCTHSITNTGTGNLITIFWTNEIFDPADTDTYFEPVFEEVA